MRAVVHRQLRAHPPCPTQRPQPPPHSKTHTAPPTAPHTAPAPAPTHHKAHSHADGSASRTHLCDHHGDARRGEEEHDGMIAHQLLLQLGHLLRLAGAPSALALHVAGHTRPARRGTRRFVPLLDTMGVKQRTHRYMSRRCLSLWLCVPHVHGMCVPARSSYE